MKFFLTPSTYHLRRSLFSNGCDIGRYESYFFADRERGYRLREDVRRRRVAIVASILPDPETLFQLLALHRLVRENGAVKTEWVVPYLGYARQDRPCRPGEGSIGIMVVELLQKIKPSRLLVVDVHSPLIRKALPSSAVELSALPLFVDALSNCPPDVIVSPDAGFMSRAEELARMMKSDADVAMIEKVRPRPNRAVARHLHGDVAGKSVLLADDMIDTGGTLAEAVKLVLEKGARSIRIAATHGIFSDNARERLSRLPVNEILVTNTLPQIRSPKIRVLDIVPSILRKLKQR
jgi:ribose-phosphate pyrophosphokinase